MPMNFQIPFEPAAFSSKLDLMHSVISVGSCFSEHMSNRLTDYKVNCLSQPFGTLYHPSAIAKSLDSSKALVDHADIIYHQDLFFHWDAHSKLWGKDIKEISDQFIREKDHVIEYLLRADWLIITLGSSYLYKIKSSGRPVANCHKQPQDFFEKTLSTSDEMFESLNQMQEKIRSFNPKIQFLYTVSPVRHIKDGLSENHISKGRLIEVTQRLTKETGVYYFPSYEIISDQLRDYRFYNADGLHPNTQAVDYIWQSLADGWFSDRLKSFIKQWSVVKQALEHKPLYPGSTSHSNFCLSILKKLEQLAAIVDVTKETDYFRSQLCN